MRNGIVPVRRARLALFVLLSLGSFAAAQNKDRETKVRNDRRDILADGTWHYNDLTGATAAAKSSGKPILVIFRCIPCEACAQLDEKIIERDSAVRRIMQEYECARIVRMNGVDLAKFQFDYDQSFAAFLMNADGTIYGRYGTRSHQTEEEGDVAIEGLAATLEKGLILHQIYPLNKDQFVAKTKGDKPPVSTAEKFPHLKKRDFGEELDYDGQVVKSCIHCHQVGESYRVTYRLEGQAIPQKILFPYPHPKILGLIMDPKTAATVTEVTPDSPAAKAGFLAGDEILSLNGQPMVSMADIQWTLHHLQEEKSLDVTLRRGELMIKMDFPLPEDWKEQGDISWRVTSWDLSRQVLGGMRLKDLEPSDRKALGLADDQLGLKVRHVGKYGDHRGALKAGVQVGDVITWIAGVDKNLDESSLLARLANATKPGQEVEVTLLRNGQSQRTKIRMQ
ncbi:Trx7/PDZ domain-containing (seleno)protein [Blastopirellula marina]|uniref:Probable MucD-putative a secreted serine proteinase n=1 Tax=Blastopirellula marina DSM 3645 TaxID=314230 RepID=A3ZTJ2_9BACT|nr:Trx7/PDZ domain-containing (seleno)protein [Blastopirellula marina]EAQ80255.1 probable MucD-putative a secreted serine proteinase [Blastopirellula marina DSM 3645]